MADMSRFHGIFLLVILIAILIPCEVGCHSSMEDEGWEPLTSSESSVVNTETNIRQYQRLHNHNQRNHNNNSSNNSSNNERIRRSLGLPQKCILKKILKKKCVSVKLKGRKDKIRWCAATYLHKLCSSVDKKVKKMD